MESGVAHPVESSSGSAVADEIGTDLAFAEIDIGAALVAGLRLVAHAESESTARDLVSQTEGDP